MGASQDENENEMMQKQAEDKDLDEKDVGQAEEFEKQAETKDLEKKDEGQAGASENDEVAQKDVEKHVMERYPMQEDVVERGAVQESADKHCDEERQEIEEEADIEGRIEDVKMTPRRREIRRKWK